MALLLLYLPSHPILPLLFPVFIRFLCSEGTGLWSRLGIDTASVLQRYSLILLFSWVHVGMRLEAASHSSKPICDIDLMYFLLSSALYWDDGISYLVTLLLTSCTLLSLIYCFLFWGPGGRYGSIYLFFLYENVLVDFFYTLRIGNLLKFYFLNIISSQHSDFIRSALFA